MHVIGNALCKYSGKVINYVIYLVWRSISI